MIVAATTLAAMDGNIQPSATPNTRVIVLSLWLALLSLLGYTKRNSTWAIGCCCIYKFRIWNVSLPAPAHTHAGNGVQNVLAKKCKMNAENKNSKEFCLKTKCIPKQHQPSKRQKKTGDLNTQITSSFVKKDSNIFTAGMWCKARRSRFSRELENF